MRATRSIPLIGAGTIALVVLVAYLGAMPETEKVQPLGYNHKLHVGDLGLGCVDCHTRVESSERASIPALEMCRQCHSGDPITGSPDERRLLDEYVAKNAEIPWERIYSLPDHVFFSHRRHVVGGKLECSECHGDVREMTRPVSRPEMLLTMENCMTCHRERLVTNDCLSCHR